MVTEGTPTGLPATAFFSKTYDEAMALAIEARDYFAHLSSAEACDLGPATGLEYCRESSRLTTQLTQVMAWLLAQRAVHEGEMTLDEARSEAHRLATAERCLADEGARHGRASGQGSLQAGLRSLLRRSTRLFQRVAQLDSMMDRDPLP